MKPDWGRDRRVTRKKRELRMISKRWIDWLELLLGTYL